MFPAYTLLPTLAPASHAMIISIGVPAVVALLLLPLAVVCVWLVSRTRSVQRDLHVIPRSRARSTVRSAA